MSKESRRIDPSIIAALIGGVVTITVTVLTLRANQSPAAQPTSIPPTAVVYTDTVAPTVAPTDTVPAGEATSTPEPPTDTPIPLPTATLIPPGADWSQNCISSLWIPYPLSITAASDDKGCLIQTVDKFYTTTGKLAFSFDERVTSAQIFGLFTKLPSDGTARVDLRPITITRGEIIMGIFASPDINSNGVILALPSTNDVTKRQKFFMKTMPGQKRFAESVDLSADPPIYDVLFDYTPGSVSVWVYRNQVELGTAAVVSGEKWLLLGYQVFSGTNTLQAEFQNLVILTR